MKTIPEPSKKLTYKKVIFFSTLFIGVSSAFVYAETVSGGGYVVQQVIAPIDGTLQGNGYILQQSSQPIGEAPIGSGYTVQSVFGTSSASGTSTPPPPAPEVITSTVISRGGYFILPPRASTSTRPVDDNNIINEVTNTTCRSTVIFTAPIDVGLSTNLPSDVKKLESFLNQYEGEKLPVNGIYEPRDVAAVKRWQLKYKTYILDPMLLKKPTGTIYTLSQRQIERQTTAPCGKPIVVTACPFFKEYASYGDRGESVKKIQLFLNIVRGEKLPVSGVYGPLTKAATKRFQQAYRKDIFNILKLSFISGNWNEATRVKANQAIGCDIVK